MSPKYSDLVEHLIHTTGFGLTGREIARYLIEVHHIPALECARAYREYVTDPEWNTYASKLLQKTSGSIFAGDKCPHAAYRTGVLRAEVANGRRIYAGSRTEALARVAFEISQAFEEMFRRGDVSKLCGYRILEYIKDRTEPVSIKDMVKEFGGSAEYVYRLKERTIDPLAELGFLKRTNGHISPTVLLSTAFDMMDEKREQILAFPQGRRWFYPFENGKVAVST